MKISPTVLKLMLAGTSGLGLAVGAASAMTIAPDVPVAVSDKSVSGNSVSDNSVTPTTSTAPTAPVELVPPESLHSPVELGARIEVAEHSREASETATSSPVEATDNSVTPTEPEPTPTPTATPAPTATPTPVPVPHRDPCLGCGMG